MFESHNTPWAPLSRRDFVSAIGLACVRTKTLLRVCSLTSPLSGLQAARNATPPKSSETSADNEISSRVRQEFLHAWGGYKQYAWGHDELKPLSKSYRDWHGVSLYMTPVDALDTMILMGMDDEALETREFIAKNLSFDRDI